MITATSTLEPEPRSLKTPDRIALATRSIASCLFAMMSEHSLSSCGAYRHMFFETALKHSHSGETTTTHGDIRKLVRGAVGVDSKKVWSSGINTAEHKMSTNMALIPKRCSV